MNEKVISNGFVRAFEGPWVNLSEVLEIVVQKTKKGMYQITGFGTHHIDSFPISGEMDSQEEAQAALDLMMLQ